MINKVKVLSVCCLVFVGFTANAFAYEFTCRIHCDHGIQYINISASDVNNAANQANSAKHGVCHNAKLGDAQETNISSSQCNTR
jgi:hypothetical protein